MSWDKNSNDEFERQTVEVWQQDESSPLSGEAMREITENLTGFFETLERWDRADGQASDRSDISGKTNAAEERKSVP